jgi:hypothetical protein
MQQAAAVPGGLAESEPVSGFRETVAGSLDQVTEHTGAHRDAIGPVGASRAGSLWGFPICQT